MNRKIEQIKKKREIKASEQALTKKQLDTQERLTKAVDGLYELLNGQEQYDFDKLHKQLVEIDKRLDLAPHFKSLEKSIKDTSHKPADKTKIDGFSELLRAIKANKVDVKIDLKKLEKTVVDISQFIQEQSKPSDQGAENYQPMRRVVKMGNRFFFDDNLTGSSSGGGGGGSGGGGTTDGLTDAELRATPVLVSTSQPDSPTLTNVTMTGSSVTLQASNTSRRNLMIFNDSSGVVYVKLGSTASSTSFTVKMVDQSYYELPSPVYTGIVTALGTSGSVRVTEVT